MKRSSNDSSNSLRLKRRVSSLFSISTVREDEEPSYGETVGLFLDESEGSSQHHHTGLIFEYGNQHVDPNNRLHKERPARIESIKEALITDEIYQNCQILETNNNILQPEDYTIHHNGYLERLETLKSCDTDRIQREAAQYQSVFLQATSLSAAQQASSALCTLVEQVMNRDLTNGFALIRPPGHHAEPTMACGYCLLNHVAIAATFAQKFVPKIVIVDWDVHHGNGTQRIFQDNPNVLYFSVHRWQNGNYFPFLSHGGPTFVGTGAGQGYTVNVGWSNKNMGDQEYLAVLQHVLWPIVTEFQPDLVLLSAGFDAAQGDLGECHVTPECFATWTRALLQYPVVASLEGGYVRSILSSCVAHVVRAMVENVSEIPPSIRLEDIDPRAARDIRCTIAVHSEYWEHLK